MTTLYSCSPSPREAVRDRVEVGGRAQQPLGDAEADRELEVVPGRAHRDRERLGLLAGTVEPDLHRLLGDELVGSFAHVVAVDRASRAPW